MFAKKKYSKAETYALEDTKSKADFLSYGSSIGIPVRILDEYLRISTEKMKKWPLQTLTIGLIFYHKNEISIIFWKKDKISIIFGFCTRIGPIFRRIYISHLIIKVQNSLVCTYYDFELSLSLTP